MGRVREWLEHRSRAPVDVPPLVEDDYWCSSRDVYRVVRVVGDRAVLESCRTGVRFELSVHELGDSICPL
jgi:hypothetical protein